jgi:Flp pilus assembly protein CpaB
MRRLLLILGAVLGVLVALGIFLWVQFTRPTVVEVPVAINDIPAGTVLRSDLFRVSRMANVDQQTISRWITLSDYRTLADGKIATSDIKAGFPIARVQIDPNTPAGAESRLSVVITGTNDYYVIIPTTPDEVGNFVQPGDRVDLLMTIPPREIPTLTISDTTATDAANAAGLEGFQLVRFPVSKLVMQNMQVLRVEREKPRQTNTQNNQNTQNTNQRTEPEVNDVKRLYVKVNRDQLEVLSFVLNTGQRNIAVRAANGSNASLPTDGVTWDDFAKWFFAQRGEDQEAITPFDAVGPYETSK